MNRHFGWAMLVVAGVLLGCLLGIHQKTSAEAPADAAAEQRDDEIVKQLKQINLQLKELNTMFRSGTARVVEVINPDKE